MMRPLTILACVVLSAATEANPIGQVLALIQKLYDTVVDDGEKEQKQYETFAVWCEDQAKEHQFEIKTLSAQAADLKATIEKASADVDVANARIGDLTQAIAANDGDLGAATSIRAKEHATFKKEEKELVESVDSLNRAQSVLSKHLNKQASFVQLPQFEELAASLSVIVDSGLFSTNDKDKLNAFLQAHDDSAQAQASESHSGGILDTLADLQEKAESILEDARKTEMHARHNFELLAQSLKDELKVQKDAVSNAKKQLEATGEVKAVAQGDLSSTTKDLNEEKGDLKELASNCQRRAVDWEVSQKSIAEELKALSDAKRIIVEATGGASSRQYTTFLQISSRRSAHFDAAAMTIKKLGKKYNNVMLTQLAGQIRATVSMNADPFAKVKGLIQGMLDKLEKQAQEEATQKAFCDKELAENEAKRHKLQNEAQKLSTRIEKATANTVRLKEQVAELQTALAFITRSQKEMDTMRQDEHAEFVKAKSDFQQGLQGVRTALRVLRDYYQSKDEAFLQTSVHKSSDAAGGIISILEVAESDFARSLAESQETEDDAVDVYEKTTQENKVATATKRAAVEGKTQESARLQKFIADASGDREGVNEELSTVLEYLDKLRPQCTTEPDSYEEQKKRREHEIEGLKDALDILENETAVTQGSSFLAMKRVRKHV
eukprot:GEMP01022652.1.p1 GENE.GEMP01022652.1~~GEMP01022652.1.p1  ORF type:complete len:667 (+),score=258.70 GEMP01022652.1:157-2157(+)